MAKQKPENSVIDGEVEQETKALATLDTSRFLALATNPADFQELIEENLGGEALNPSDMPRVTVPGGSSAPMWNVTTSEGQTGVKELTGVIIYHQLNRALWLNQENSNRPPDCSSPGATTGSQTVQTITKWAKERGIDYDPVQALKDGKGFGFNKQPCDSCPFAKFGTGRNGGQACSLKRAVFVLQEGDIIPTPVIIPTASLGGSKQYFMRLLNMKLPLHGVVTSFTLTPDKNKEGKPFYKVSLTNKERLTEVEAAGFKTIRELMLPVLNNMNKALALANEAESEARPEYRELVIESDEIEEYPFDGN